MDKHSIPNKTESTHSSFAASISSPQLYLCTALFSRNRSEWQQLPLPLLVYFDKRTLRNCIFPTFYEIYHHYFINLAKKKSTFIVMFFVKALPFCILMPIFVAQDFFSFFFLFLLLAHTTTNPAEPLRFHHRCNRNLC